MVNRRRDLFIDIIAPGPLGTEPKRIPWCIRGCKDLGKIKRSEECSSVIELKRSYEKSILVYSSATWLRRPKPNLGRAVIFHLVGQSINFKVSPLIKLPLLYAIRTSQLTGWNDKINKHNGPMLGWRFGWIQVQVLNTMNDELGLVPCLQLVLDQMNIYVTHTTIFLESLLPWN